MKSLNLQIRTKLVISLVKTPSIKAVCDLYTSGQRCVDVIDVFAHYALLKKLNCLITLKTLLN